MSNAGGNGFRGVKSGRSSVRADLAVVAFGTSQRVAELYNALATPGWLIQYRSDVAQAMAEKLDREILGAAGCTGTTTASWEPANDAEGAD